MLSVLNQHQVHLKTLITYETWDKLSYHLRFVKIGIKKKHTIYCNRSLPVMIVIFP